MDLSINSWTENVIFNCTLTNDNKSQSQAWLGLQVTSVTPVHLCTSVSVVGNLSDDPRWSSLPNLYVLIMPNRRQQKWWTITSSDNFPLGFSFLPSHSLILNKANCSVASCPTERSTEQRTKDISDQQSMKNFGRSEFGSRTPCSQAFRWDLCSGQHFDCSLVR